MTFKREIPWIDGLAAVRAVGNTLRCFDKRLVDHGERVAFITGVMLERGGLELDPKLLFLLSVFHDIGAYKTEEIDRMIEFETGDVLGHSVYGYLFLKYMTPLGDAAEAILYHHTDYDRIDDGETAYKEYAALIFLADRADIAMSHIADPHELDSLFSNEKGHFSQRYTELFEDCMRGCALRQRLADGSYKEFNEGRFQGFGITQSEAVEYIKMLVYTIDFRSEYTVTHTVNSVALTMNIAEHFGLSEQEKDKLFVAALLHDVGRVAIPVKIIEPTRRPDSGEMELIRSHVDESVGIIRGVVPEEIVNIVACHHERLDGSGYPRGLTGGSLGFAERILAVADVASAVGSDGAYKERLLPSEAVAFLTEQGGEKLDKRVCDYLCGNYEQIVIDTNPMRAEIIRRYQAMNEEYKILEEIYG